MRSLALAVVLAVAGCGPTPVGVADLPSPTVNIDPPYVSDAAGVPQPATGDAATGDGADVLPAPGTPPTPPAATIIPGPDGTTIAGRCTQWEPLLAAAGVGWDVARMSRILWRESRCKPDAYNRRTHDRGLGQVHWTSRYWSVPMRSGFGPLAQECGITYLDQLFVPEVNIGCMAALYRAFGMKPWGRS